MIAPANLLMTVSGGGKNKPPHIPLPRMEGNESAS